MSLGWGLRDDAAPVPPDRSAVPPLSILHSLSVPLHSSRTIQIPHLTRVALSTDKHLRLRTIPPDRLLLTGLTPGTTTLRVWTASGTELAYTIHVPVPDPADVVKVALELMEVDSVVSQALGVRWPEAIQFSAAASLAGDLSTSGLNYTSGFSTARGLIQHLVRNGWAKLLAKPDLYVRLGEEAHFHSGGEYPIAISVPSHGRYQRQVDWKPYGLTVKVRPDSGDRVLIRSDVKVDVSELNPGVGMEGLPSLTRRRLDTKMTSEDGETVILSGLVRQISGLEDEGVPILSSIPLLGSLFSRRETRGDTTEIFMAMTLAFTTRERVRSAVEERRGRLEAASPR